MSTIHLEVKFKGNAGIATYRVPHVYEQDLYTLVDWLTAQEDMSVTTEQLPPIIDVAHCSRCGAYHADFDTCSLGGG